MLAGLLTCGKAMLFGLLQMLSHTRLTPCLVTARYWGSVSRRSKYPHFISPVAICARCVLQTVSGHKGWSSRTFHIGTLVLALHTGSKFLRYWTVIWQDNQVMDNYGQFGKLLKHLAFDSGGNKMPFILHLLYVLWKFGFIPATP